MVEMVQFLVVKWLLTGLKDEMEAFKYRNLCDWEFHLRVKEFPTET